MHYKEYVCSTDIDIYECEWNHRCITCDLPCVSERGVGVNIHMMSRGHKPEKYQGFKDRLPSKWVHRTTKEQTSGVLWWWISGNIFRSKHLGSRNRHTAEIWCGYKYILWWLTPDVKCEALWHMIQTDLVSIWNCGCTRYPYTSARSSLMDVRRGVYA